MKKFVVLAMITGALVLIPGLATISASATPLSVTGSTERGDSNVELARHHRRQNRTRGSGIPVFIVPGFYWGPGWWDANYWRQRRSRRNCGNWLFPC